MMIHRFTSNILHRTKMKLDPYRSYCYSMQDISMEILPVEWYRAAYAKLLKLNHVLENIRNLDGKMLHVKEGSVVTDTHIINQMQSFNALAKLFIRRDDFEKVNTVTINSLTKVCNLLNISAQKRKHIRLTICPLVTQHHVWRGAVEEILHNLTHEMQILNVCTPSFQMCEQILSNCLDLFSNSRETPSWMKPAPLNKVEKPMPSQTWGEVLEMFIDMTKCFEHNEYSFIVSKIEDMKEGLYQIKDIIIERDMSYKEVKRQDCLVQKILSKHLGHSSKCLFTLLMYYLFGSVHDIEIQVFWHVRERDGKSGLQVGKILHCSDEENVMIGIKELNKVIKIFKFVWDSADMNEVLELQGHLWCFGAEERSIKYRGNVFQIHGCRL